MGNLLATLSSSTSALTALDKMLTVVQNNVANSSTTGYASQSASLVARSFDTDAGTTGGVTTSAVLSSRSQYAEQTVRNETSDEAYSSQMVTTLTTLDGLFDVTGTSGIAKDLSSLYSAFSSWSEDPTSTSTRQAVLDAAAKVAKSFQDTANNVQTVATSTESQTTATIDSINALTKQIQSYNEQIKHGGNGDAGLDAQMNNAIENLSELVNVTATQETDGTYTVLLDGQVPLVSGDKQTNLVASLISTDATAPGTMQIATADGTDVTAKTTGGTLGALVSLRNTTIAGLIGSSSESGSLNELTTTFANGINNILTACVTSTDPVVEYAPALFTYSADATQAAQSLAVNSAITLDDLPATDLSDSTAASNSIPLALAALTDTKTNGYTVTETYANIAAGVGTALTEATDTNTTDESLLAQAKTLRTDISGVSLDTEATLLIQFQRAYQANAKIITVLDSLAETTINILQ
jgi:flagellar hook-associated protein 1